MNSWKECLIKANNNRPKSTDIIPELGIIPLPQFTLMQVEDKETITHLEHEYSFSAEALKNNKELRYTSQCNSQGKLTANQLFFQADKYLSYCIYSNVLDNHLTQLRKNKSIQTDTILPRKDLCIFGVFGNNAPHYMQQHFHNGNTVTIFGSGYILALKDNRYIFALPEDEALIAINNIGYNKTYPSDFWTLLDIQSGIPNISSEISDKYFLQSFSQVGIPDTPYYHSLYIITGLFDEVLTPGTLVKKELDNNLFNCGEITASFRFDDRFTLALAMMSDESEIEKNHFRVKNTNIHLLPFYE